VTDTNARWPPIFEQVYEIVGGQLLVSNICTAFDWDVIGSKIEDHSGFIDELREAIWCHRVEDRVPGQHYIVMPEPAHATVSCGVGPRVDVESAYVVRRYRGRVGLYLDREHAAQVEHLAAVVYTREAYLNDPDVVNDPEEKERVARHPNVTHVLITVLASAGGKSPLPGHTLLRNLAGANHEAQVWSADEIRAKARESLEFWEKWAVVAD
jgi:hypothetical protein